MILSKINNLERPAEYSIGQNKQFQADLNSVERSVVHFYSQKRIFYFFSKMPNKFETAFAQADKDGSGTIGKLEKLRNF